MRRLAITVAIAAVAVVALTVLPLLSQQQPESDIPVLLIPALASETYTYSQAQGMLAVLEASNGLRFEVPHAWLPGDAQVGGAFRVTSNVQPQQATTTLNVSITPLK